MDSKLFKAFTPFINLAGGSHGGYNLNGLQTRPAEDPGLTQWRSFGFLPMDGIDYAIDIQGAAWLACVQINERILPGSVLREKIVAKALDIQDRTGRKPSKKEMAELRDEVERELLPTAFIRRKLVPVMFIRDKVLCFTSSAKVSDDVMALLVSCMGDDEFFNPTHVESMVQESVVPRLTEIARRGQSDTIDEDEVDEIPFFLATNSMVLKGEGKQVIRVKDKDVNAHEIVSLLATGYDVHSLGVDFVEAGDTDAAASMVINHKLVVSAFKLVESLKVSGRNKEDAEATFIGTAYIVARTAHDVLDTIIAAMGGLRPVERATGHADRIAVPVRTAAEVMMDSEDDDEL